MDEQHIMQPMKPRIDLDGPEPQLHRVWPMVPCCLDLCIETAEEFVG